MQCAQLMLSLETESTEAELLDVLRNLTVASLKSLCNGEFMKVSGNKADLIGCLLTLWKRKGTGTDSDTLVGAHDAGSGTATDSSTVELPVLAEIQKWKKDFSSLKDFTFMQL